MTTTVSRETLEGKTMTEIRTQVAQQCKAIAHMATALADVFASRGKLVECGRWPDDMLDDSGRRTAELMETFGDILNGMDAVDESEDAWIFPVLKEARRVWPAASTI